MLLALGLMGRTRSSNWVMAAMVLSFVKGVCQYDLVAQWYPLLYLLVMGSLIK